MLKSTLISLGFLMFKLSVLLCSINLCFSCLRWLTPRLDQRLVYFGNFGRDEAGWMNNEGPIGQLTLVDEKLFNRRRLDLSKAILNRVKNSWPEKQSSKDLPWLSIGIVAPRVNGELTQVIGHLLGVYQLTSNQIPQITICNTEAEGKKSRELAELLNFTTNSSLFDVIDLNESGLGEPYQSFQDFAKENMDYWNCLETIGNRSSTAKYLLLFEDDALPIPELPKAIQYLAKQLDRRSSIDYVKLSHPWRWRGVPWAVQSIGLSFGIGSLILILSRNPFQFHNLALAFMVASGTHLIIRSKFYQLFSDLRFLITGGPQMTWAESCCTQAIIFRASRSQEIAKTLRREKAVRGHAKDHILEESQFRGRQTDTNLVVHIGWYSFLRQGFVPTGEIFP